MQRIVEERDEAILGLISRSRRVINNPGLNRIGPFWRFSNYSFEKSK